MTRATSGAEAVRLTSRKLPSGLYAHRIVRYVFRPRGQGRRDFSKR